MGVERVYLDVTGFAILFSTGVRLSPENHADAIQVIIDRHPDLFREGGLGKLTTATAKSTLQTSQNTFQKSS